MLTVATDDWIRFGLKPLQYVDGNKIIKLTDVGNERGHTIYCFDRSFDRSIVRSADFVRDESQLIS